MTDIALFIPSLGGGGAEKMMVKLANYFVDQGLEVDLILVRKSGVYLDTVHEQVNIIDLKSTRTLTSLPNLVLYLRKNQPKAILSALSHANIICIIAKKISRTKCVTVLSQRNIASNQLNTNIKNFFSLKLLTWAYNSSDAIVAISEGVKEDLVAKLGINRNLVHTIYNPAYPSDVNIDNLIKPLHPFFHLQDKPQIIIAVGRLEPVKDFATLIKAYSLIYNKINTRLIILGQGSELNYLIELTEKLNLSDFVSFPGFVEEPYSFMKYSDLFVSTSKSEGFGNVVVEAMACGTPVVATDCPSGPAEILEGGLWGSLVPIGDFEKLADTILQSLSMDCKPNVTERARQFSIDKIASQYYQLLSMTL